MWILSGLVEFRCFYRKIRTPVNGPVWPRLRTVVLISAALVLLCRWGVAAPAEASWSGVLRDNSGTIPNINISDSATGSGSNKQLSSTLPATIAVAASWDRQLAFDYAVQIARELRAQGFGMGLGGGTNLAREPRCGRNFEYLGEDPVLSGELLTQRTWARRASM